MAETVSPEKDVLCWSQKDCVDARSATMDEGTAKQGWIQEGNCTGDWGKCLAGAITKTQITFAGSNSFTDMGVFIKLIYRYAISVIGIIAAVVIIISGLQWTASAGNSEVINTAKNRIFGALIGSFIAFMSYAILSAINPATVNLRLPQVWMIRNLTAPPRWCQENEKFTDNALFRVDDIFIDGIVSKVPAAKIFKGGSFLKKETHCGIQFLIPDGSGTCLGNSCNGTSVKVGEEAKTCGIDIPCACNTAGTEWYACVPAFIGGEVKLANIDHYVQDVTLNVLCSLTNQDNVISRVGKVDSSVVGKKMNGNYAISFFEKDVESAGKNICGNGYNLEGFALTAEVKDNEGILGAIDDTWLIGFNSCGNGKKPFAGFNFIGPTSILWENPENLNIMAALATSGGMFTVDDVKNGFTCDLDISLGSYPSLSGDYYKP